MPDYLISKKAVRQLCIKNEFVMERKKIIPDYPEMKKEEYANEF